MMPYTPDTLKVDRLPSLTMYQLLRCCTWNQVYLNELLERLPPTPPLDPEVWGHLELCSS